MRLLFAGLGVAALLAEACASGSAPSGGQAAAPPAPEPTSTPQATPTVSTGGAPHRAGGITRFALYRRDSLVVEMPGGGSQAQAIGQTTYLRVTLTPAEPGYAVEIVVDSIRPDPDLSLPRALLDSAIGTHWTGHLAPNGRLGELRTSASSLVADQLQSQLSLLFPVQPDGGARPGSAWNDSVTGPVRTNALAATERAELSCRAAGYDAVRASQALRVECARRSTIAGAGQQFGQDMTLNGSGTASLLYHLGSGGDVLTLEGQESNDLTITVLAVGQAVPARQEARFTLARLF